MAKWYISVESKASGPYETSEILDAIRGRKYVLVDLVFQEGGANWQSLGEVDEFRTVFEDIRAQEESRSQIDSHLHHPWILLKKKNLEIDQPSNYLQSGPFSLEEVLTQISNGQLRHSDYAWKKGFEKWVRVGFIEDFDRMRNLDENSFVNYKMPIPDLNDPSELVDSPVHLKASVQVVAKDSAANLLNREDREETDLFKDIFNDFEVTSVDAVNETTPVPQSQKPAALESQPIRPEERDRAIEAPKDESNEILQNKKSAKVPSEVLAELSRGIPEKILTQPNSAPQTFDNSLDKTLIRPAQKASQEEKASFEEATQVYVPASKPVQVLQSTDEPRSKKSKSKSKKEKRAEALSEVDFSALDEPRQKHRRPFWQKAILGAFAVVLISTGAFLIKNKNIFSSPSQKWANLFEIEFHKLIDSEVGGAKVRNDGLVAAPKAATQDPNLKSKTETQMESGTTQKVPDAPIQSGAQAANQALISAPAPVPPTLPAVKATPLPPPDAQIRNQRATWVDLEVKSPAQTPHLNLLTDGGDGTVFQVYISARTGELVTYPSFFKNYRSIKKSTRPSDLDLSILPPGRYNIDVEIGDIKKVKSVFIREEEFNSRIESHLKQVSFEQQKEKKALFYGAKTLEALEKKMFEVARLAPKQNKEWSNFHSGLRQNTKSSLSSLLTSLTDSNRNNYAYPDDIFDLVDAKDELLRTADEIDRNIKQKKAIDTPAEQNIFKALEKIRKHASVLSVRKFTY
jgi:hypothetical protein